MRKCEWTFEQEEYLRGHYADDDLQDIADAIGKTVRAVQMRASALGVKRPRHTSLSKEEQKFIKEHANTLSIKEIARRTKRSYHTIHDFVFKNCTDVKEKKMFKCCPPDSCFKCPHADCISGANGMTAKENEWLSKALKKQEDKGVVVRRRV